MKIHQVKKILHEIHKSELCITIWERTLASLKFGEQQFKLSNLKSRCERDAYILLFHARRTEIWHEIIKSEPCFTIGKNEQQNFNLQFRCERGARRVIPRATHRNIA